MGVLTLTVKDMEGMDRGQKGKPRMCFGVIFSFGFLSLSLVIAVMQFEYFPLCHSLCALTSFCVLCFLQCYNCELYNEFFSAVLFPKA